MIKPAYKRLETDDEFLQRIPATHREQYRYFGYSGRGLDAAAWNDCEIQRRIVEVFP